MSKTLRTTTYLVRMTAEEKASLEQKTRVLAARKGKSITLAHVLREGARIYLDELLENVPRLDEDTEAVDGPRHAV